MIRTDAEYQLALQRLKDERERVREQDKAFKAQGFDAAARKRMLDPLRSFYDQLAEEVESYERLLSGDLGELQNLHGMGRLLVGLRLARGMSQRELAEKLEVHETQVSRDERNEYHGVTVERASRILDVLQADVRTTVRRGPRRAVRAAPRAGSGGPARSRTRRSSGAPRR
jgi:hypothetical protein